MSPVLIIVLAALGALVLITAIVRYSLNRTEKKTPEEWRKEIPDASDLNRNVWKDVI